LGKFLVLPLSFLPLETRENDRVLEAEACLREAYVCGGITDFSEADGCGERLLVADEVRIDSMSFGSWA
jgi:hypothetical protein